MTVMLLVLFVLYCGVKLLSGVTCFLLKDLDLVFLVRYISWQWILSIFVYLWMFHFNFWKVVLLDRIFFVDHVFFENFGYIIPMPIDLHFYWLKVIY